MWTGVTVLQQIKTLKGFSQYFEVHIVLSVETLMGMQLRPTSFFWLAKGTYRGFICKEE